MNILFIHGRAQEEYTQKTLLDNWTTALKGSFSKAGIEFPEGLSLTLPYYGKELIVQRELYKEDIANGVYQMRAPEILAELNDFEKELLEILRENAGISKKEVVAEVDADEQNRGVENWGVTIAITRLLDRHFNSTANGCVKKRTDDVVTYLVLPDARKKINSFYLEALTAEPTIIIAHSLGTIIAYDILRSIDPGKHDIRGLITLGSPLGVSAVQRQLHPPAVYPKGLKGNWVNLFDPKDIVALNPLNRNNFRVDPEIKNHEIYNGSDNRHKIGEYLSNPLIAETMVKML